MLAKIKDFEEGIVSTIKAITAIEKLDIDFDVLDLDFSAINSESFRKKQISLPQISGQNDFEKARAFGDLAALYLKFNNRKIRQILPDEDSQKLFDSFEKIRVIKQGSESFKGSASNIEPLIDKELETIVDYSFLPFLILDNPALQTRIGGFKKITGKDLLKKIAQLGELTSNQEKFAQKSLEIIEFLNDQKNDQGQEDGESQDKTEPESQDKENDEQNNNEENIEAEVQIDKSKPLIKPADSN